MKKGKRLLALILAVMMTMTCFVAVASAEETATGGLSDVAEDAIYATAVKTFNLMGIIKGYEDGTFCPDQNVTRAEFTAMLMRTMNLGGLGSASVAGLPFTDVDENDTGINWAIPDINTAYAKGIINGYEDATFRPGANVSYEEAIKMIVCTLGYVSDVNVTPWYAEYVNQATRLGITETARNLGQVETPASRACIAQMLYDSLEVPIVENEKLTKKTILTDYLGYEKGEGKIASDGITSLTQPDANLRDDEVQIYGRSMGGGDYELYTYKTTDPQLRNYLGYEIEYFYKDNGSSIRTLGIYLLRENQTVKLRDDMIEESVSSDSQIRYYKNENDKSTTVANLDADNVVIYNGKLLGEDAESSRFSVDLIPQVGSMTLLDSDNDNKFDLVKIEEYEVYYVSSKVSLTYSIIDDVTKTGKDKELILDVKDTDMATTIVTNSGAEYSYNSINVGDIVCVATSSQTNGGEVIRKAVVVTETVTGTVTAVEEGESLTINGNTYKYSKAAPWLNGLSSVLAEPALQDVGVFCLDMNGDVVAYKADSVVENIYYGYIMGIEDTKGSFDNEKEMRILTQSGSIITAELRDKVRVDGTPCTAEEAYDLLVESAKMQNNDENENCTVQQLVKYTTKSSGGTTVVDKIYTAVGTSTGMKIEGDELYFYNKVTGADSMKYTYSTKKLSNKDTNIAIGSATVFVVPTDRTDYSDYIIKTVDAVFKSNQSYNVEFFDVSKTNSAKIVVCYGGNASSEVDSSTPLSVLTEKVDNMANPDNGEAMKKLTGYSSSYSGGHTELSGWLSNESTWTPSLGDIFRAGTDREGFLKIEEDDVIYSAANGIENYGYTIDPSSGVFDSAEFAVLMGSVVATDDESIALLPEKVEEGQTEVDLSDAVNISISTIKSARVFLYDVDEDDELTVRLVGSDEIDGIIKSLVEYSEDGLTNPTKMLVYKTRAVVRMVYILDDAE